MSQMDIRDYEDKVLQSILLGLSHERRWNSGTKLPANYLIVDTETLGLSCVNDRIVQLAMLVVENGQPSNRYWDGEPIFTTTIKHDPKEFVGKEQAIAVHGITAEKSAKEGIEPRDAFSMFYEVWEDARKAGFKIVGHNCYRFDLPFLMNEVLKFCGQVVRYDQKNVIDTGLLVKASQTNTLLSMDDTVFDYYARLADLRAKGIYFNLAKYCLVRYAFDKKHGANTTLAHDAGYDVWLTYLLMQEFDKLLSVPGYKTYKIYDDISEVDPHEDASIDDEIPF